MYEPNVTDRLLRAPLPRYTLALLTDQYLLDGRLGVFLQNTLLRPTDSLVL